MSKAQQLHAACTKSDLRAVMNIVGEAPDTICENICVEESKYFCGNAFHAAAVSGSVDVLRVLHQIKPACLDVINKLGYSAIHFATIQGNGDAVQFLLENGANINIRAHDGSTPLIMAASKNNAEIVGLLLRKGADIKLSNADGNTALHAVLIKKKCRKTLELLLSFGACVQAKNKSSEDVLQLARNLHNDEALKVLEAHMEKN